MVSRKTESERKKMNIFLNREREKERKKERKKERQSIINEF